MIEGAAGRSRNPPPATRSASVPILSTSPATDASTRGPSRGGRSHRRGGEVESPAPPTASAGRLRGVGLSALQRRSNHQVPCEGGPPADLLGRDKPPIASSSPHSSHAQRAPTAATMSPRPCGEATAWTTPTCRSNPSLCWAHHHSTTALAMGLHWRRSYAPPPSSA
jgi:hypothetical protein